MWMRNLCYDLKILQVNDVGVPVISVGNMTTGGTGKTPFVELLVRMLSVKGKKIAVISRGYKRITSGNIVVSDGVALRESVQRSGDEPYQIARKYPHVIVIVDEKRARGARLAVNTFDAGVIVLDDGFQHRALHRDLDIVMMPAATPLSSLRMLPSGTRREPLSSLDRADLLAFSPSPDGTVHAVEVSLFSEAPVIRVIHKPIRLISLGGDHGMELSSARGKSCVALCGIGSPQSFRKTLDEIGVVIKDFMVFADHHSYTQSDLRRVGENIGSQRPEIIIMTEKDSCSFLSLIKKESPKSQQGFMDPASPFMRRTYYLEIEMEIVDGAEILEHALDAALKEAA